MKISLQYINDDNGNAQAVQLPVADWKKVVSYIKKSEQALKIRADLQITLEQQKSKKEQTIKPFTHKELNDRIAQSEKDFKNKKIKSSSELLAKYQ